jgi:N-acetylmuramoyl-L-alanine amidase
LAILSEERQWLTWGQDASGKYAVYRLKKGEAIYSAVVVRYCGLVRAVDVNRVASELIRFNNIKDETDLAIGTPLKIPDHYLEPEYKEETDPAYLDFIKNQQELTTVEETFNSRTLKDVVVFLDAGHGGRDPGAKIGNTWEDDYVYDILCRLKVKIDKESLARTVPLIEDPSVGFKVQDVAQFILDQDEVLRTTPRFHLNSHDTKHAVNMRWVMTNHHFREFKKKGISPDQMVFISLHADSLHPSISGAMVYVPDARAFPNRTVMPYASLRSFTEYAQGAFSANHKEMQRAQALSTRTARQIIDAMRKRSLAVHQQKPIRSEIYRSKKARPFVPAVLNYNLVPRRMLVEVCNLNNRKDRENLRNPRFREDIAEALYEALLASFQK